MVCYSTIHVPAFVLLFPNGSIQLSRARPFERCDECGSVYRMDYVGPADDPHDHGHHHGYEEPKTMADYVKPEYWYR